MLSLSVTEPLLPSSCPLDTSSLIALYGKVHRPCFEAFWCILDLSKTLIYDFHYDYIKIKYNDKAKLLFTDTDSLAYEIELKMHIKIFGMIRIISIIVSIQKTPHISIGRTKVIGKFKDEVSGIPINEFTGLRSKMYSYLKDTDECSKTAKGIKKNIIKKDIKHENYKDVLFNNKQVYHKMKKIGSQRHQLGSYEINKISLSCFDDKRYLYDNGIHSYAYGGYEI